MYERFFGRIIIDQTISNNQLKRAERGLLERLLSLNQNVLGHIIQTTMAKIKEIIPILDTSLYHTLLRSKEAEVIP